MPRLFSNHQIEARVNPPGESGFVLVSVIFAIVIISVVSIGALVSSNDEQVTGRAIRDATDAFYAANAGLSAELAGWDQAARDADLVMLGDSVDLGWTTLENGSSYRAVVRLTGLGGQKHYSLNVTGRNASQRAQRELRLHLLLSVSDFCCDSAVLGTSYFQIDEYNEGVATVSGYDSVPAGWEARCSSEMRDVPGALWSDTTLVENFYGSILEGVPPMVEDATMTEPGLLAWGNFDYDSLVALADITYSSATSLDGDDIYPRLSGGTCDKSSSLNWGAPEDPSHDCFDYFPIIHLEDDVGVYNGTGAGQGILLVDEELELEDGFRFYGLIIAKGGSEIDIEWGAQVYGAIVAADGLEVQSGARVQYSRCAAHRALGSSGLGTLRPLVSRAWEQVQN